MDDSAFDLHLDDVAAEVLDRGATRVLVQLPEGLRWRGPTVLDALREALDGSPANGGSAGGDDAVELLLAGEPSFGACDLADRQAAALGCDLMVHFGHTGFPNLGDYAVPVLFAPVTHTRRAPVEPLLEEAVDLLTPPVGLLSTSQDVDLLDEAQAWLADRGVEARIGEGKGRIALAGQVLGCNYTAGRAVEDAESYLFIGSGDFHPLGLAMALDKPTIVADPETGEVRDLAELKDRVLRQRHAAIEAARDATRWGLIVSTKAGQFRAKQAERLKAKARDAGLDATVLVLDTVTPEELSTFTRLEAFVNLACPRIATDDHHRYKRPLLTPVEFEILLGERDWEEWRFDELP